MAKKTKKKLTKKQKLKRQRLLKIALILIFVLSLNGAIFGLVYLNYRKTILSFAVAPSVSAPLHLRNEVPVRIEINGVGINLPIVQGQIKEGLWETSETLPTYLASSARPGEGSNIVIYGHRKKAIFAPLHNVKVGDEITIEDNAGRKFRYRVDTTRTVKPSHIEVVLPTDHEVLTVYTCIGFLDSERFVVQAIPIGVRSK